MPDTYIHTYAGKLGRWVSLVYVVRDTHSVYAALLGLYKPHKLHKPLPNNLTPPIMKIQYPFTWGLLLLLFLAPACSPEEELTSADIPVADAAPKANLDLAPLLAQYGDRTTAVTGSLRSTSSGVTLSADFRAWLNANGYGSYNFAREDLIDDSYGGRAYAGQPVTKHPVIFIHGNSDKALGTATGQTGWTSSINYFLSQGYTSAELYAITWGPADASQAAYQYHSKAYLTRIRKFIEAVLAYTGASKVDIVCHSMGVTLSRKAVKGGTAYDPNAGGSYSLGGSLTSQVDAFVGIAGGNRGLTSCFYSSAFPTCDDVNGFYPGYLIGFYGPYGVSDYLVDLNSTSGYEGAYRYSIWSSVDEIIGYGCVVYGQNTCRLPGQTGQKAYYSYPYGHFNVKDLTQAVQYNMVRFHSIP